MPSRIYVAAAALLACVPSASADEHPLAKDLLLKYQLAVRRLSQVHIEADSKLSILDIHPGAKEPAPPDKISSIDHLTIYHDDSRWRVTRISNTRRWFDGKPGDFRNGGEYVLGDEGLHVQWSIPANGKGKDEAGLVAYLDASEAERRLWHGYMKMAVILFGQTSSDDCQPLWQVMRDAPNLELLPTMKVVDGAKTYVLKSRGKFGVHTVWLDPDKAYLARRIEVRKVTGDLLNSRRLGMWESNKAVADKNRGPAVKPDVEIKEILDRFDKFEIDVKEGKPVIMAFDWTRKIVNENASGSHYREEFRVRSIDFDPNRWPENTFSPSIEMDEGRPVPVSHGPDTSWDMNRYEWRRGKGREKN